MIINRIKTRTAYTATLIKNRKTLLLALVVLMFLLSGCSGDNGQPLWPTNSSGAQADLSFSLPPDKPWPGPLEDLRKVLIIFMVETDQLVGLLILAIGKWVLSNLSAINFTLPEAQRSCTFSASTGVAAVSLLVGCATQFYDITRYFILSSFGLIISYQALKFLLGSIVRLPELKVDWKEFSLRVVSACAWLFCGDLIFTIIKDVSTNLFFFLLTLGLRSDGTSSNTPLHVTAWNFEGILQINGQTVGAVDPQAALDQFKDLFDIGKYNQNNLILTVVLFIIILALALFLGVLIAYLMVLVILWVTWIALLPLSVGSSLVREFDSYWFKFLGRLKGLAVSWLPLAVLLNLSFQVFLGFRNSVQGGSANILQLLLVLFTVGILFFLAFRMAYGLLMNEVGQIRQAVGTFRQVVSGGASFGADVGTGISGIKFVRSAYNKFSSLRGKASGDADNDDRQSQTSERGRGTTSPSSTYTKPVVAEESERKSTIGARSTSVYAGNSGEAAGSGNTVGRAEINTLISFSQQSAVILQEIKNVLSRNTNIMEDGRNSRVNLDKIPPLPLPLPLLLSANNSGFPSLPAATTVTATNRFGANGSDSDEGIVTTTDDVDSAAALLALSVPIQSASANSNYRRVSARVQQPLFPPRSYSKVGVGSPTLIATNGGAMGIGAVAADRNNNGGRGGGGSWNNNQKRSQVKDVDEMLPNVVSADTLPAGTSRSLQQAQLDQLDYPQQVNPNPGASSVPYASNSSSSSLSSSFIPAPTASIVIEAGRTAARSVDTTPEFGIESIEIEEEEEEEKNNPHFGSVQRALAGMGGVTTPPPSVVLSKPATPLANASATEMRNDYVPIIAEFNSTNQNPVSTLRQTTTAGLNLVIAPPVQQPAVNNLTLTKGKGNSQPVLVTRPKVSQSQSQSQEQRTGRARAGIRTNTTTGYTGVTTNSSEESNSNNYQSQLHLANPTAPLPAGTGQVPSLPTPPVSLVGLGDTNPALVAVTVPKTENKPRNKPLEPPLAPPAPASGSQLQQKQVAGPGSIPTISSSSSGSGSSPTANPNEQQKPAPPVPTIKPKPKPAEPSAGAGAGAGAGAVKTAKPFRTRTREREQNQVIRRRPMPVSTKLAPLPSPSPSPSPAREPHLPTDD